jgi:DsbC/DsbD-like thiol-disulfide interchange protein
MKHRTLTCLALIAALATPAVAQERLEDIVRIEVLDGGTTARGTHRAALHLTLAEGWKTYWRAPGDAGIPPRFNWRGSRNLAAMAITWPTPKVFDQNGMRSIGYAHQLVLPLEITTKTPGQAIRLKGEIEIGVCKDVCVPATLNIDHPLNAKAGRNPAIAAAMAQRPFSEKEAGVTSARCSMVPTRHGMQIEAHIAMPHSGGTEVAVIEPGNPQIWASEATTRRDGNTLIAVSELIHVDQGSFVLDRSAIRITVLGDRHAVDIRGCTPG